MANYVLTDDRLAVLQKFIAGLNRLADESDGIELDPACGMVTRDGDVLGYLRWREAEFVLEVGGDG